MINGERKCRNIRAKLVSQIGKNKLHWKWYHCVSCLNDKIPFDREIVDCDPCFIYLHDVAIQSILSSERDSENDEEKLKKKQQTLKYRRAREERESKRDSHNTDKTGYSSQAILLDLVPFHLATLKCIVSFTLIADESHYYSDIYILPICYALCDLNKVLVVACVWFFFVSIGVCVCVDVCFSFLKLSL